MHLKFLLITLVLLTTYTASTQDFDKRLKAQKTAIETAYKKKQISEKEYYKLLNEQDIIKRTIDNAKADDIMTPKEKNAIHSKQERAEKRMRRYKTNREVF